MRRDYEIWLIRQGYQSGTVVTQLQRAGRVESEYGDLDKHYAADELCAVIDAMTYSTEDERIGKPNPTRIRIEGVLRTNLASYKNAVVLYRRFLDETGPGWNAPDPRDAKPAAESEVVRRRHANRIQPQKRERTSPTERLTKMRLLLGPALEPFVTSTLTRHFGSSWKDYARTPDRFDPRSKLDTHVILFLMLNNWHEVFRATLPIHARAAVVAALDGRNAEAHAAEDIEPYRALRAISAAVDLLELAEAQAAAKTMAKVRDELMLDIAQTAAFTP